MNGEINLQVAQAKLEPVTKVVLVIKLGCQKKTQKLHCLASGNMLINGRLVTQLLKHHQWTELNQFKK